MTVDTRALRRISLCSDLTYSAGQMVESAADEIDSLRADAEKMKLELEHCRRLAVFQGHVCGGSGNHSGKFRPYPQAFCSMCQKGIDVWMTKADADEWNARRQADLDAEREKDVEHHKLLNTVVRRG